MGSKAKKITVGFKYFMGLFMGLSRGPVNEITEIRVGDRTAWTGSVTRSQTIQINKPELFGGTKAEGGVEGPLEIYMGESNQSISQALRNMLGGRQPQFRGVVTMFFDGLVCAMSPYPKAWKFKTRRSTAGWEGGVWYEPKCLIKMTGYDAAGKEFEIHAMNPVHIIYECQSNVAWGRGLDRSQIDDVSFRKAADQCYTEGFGLCMRWTRQDTLQAFMQLILDHVGGVLSVSKQTGKLTIRLIRDDYDSDNLPIFDMDSGLLSIEEATNASPADFVNEVIVTYHNPIMEEDQQVRCHNLAQIQNQGCLNSNTVDYKGVPTGKLAMILAQRDLRVSSTNVRRFTITCDRRAWSIEPGAVFKLRDPKQRGLTEVIVRVGTVEDGTLPDGKIKIVAVQDQFAFRLNTFNQVEPPSGYEPDLSPAIARRIVYEVPYVDLVQQLPEADLNTVAATDAFINSQAEKPTAMSAAFDMGIKAEGESSYDIRGNGDFGSLGALQADVDYLDTQFRLGELSLWEDVVVGAAARISKPVLPGQTTQMEIAEEFVRIDAISGGIITVARGVMDTIPQRHQKGELLWVTSMDGGTDWQRYAGNEKVDIKILPWTLGGGRYPIEDAPVDHIDFNFRQIRPYPPGNVQWELASNPGQKFYWYNPSALTYTAAAGETPDSYTLTWAHRDRKLQADKLIDFHDGDLGPEPGTTYLIRVYAPDGSIVRTESGITGTTWVYPYATAANDLNVEAGTVDPVLATVRLVSTRNNRECWEYYETKISVYKKPPQFAYLASFMQQAAQPFNPESAGEPDYEPDGGASMANLMQQVTQISSFPEADSMAGPNIALLPHQVTQESSVIVPLDALLYEAPYIDLYRNGNDLTHSQVLSFVARASDRTVDSYTLFTKHEADTDYASAGVQPWTPWGMSTAGLGFFNDEITVGNTSDKDGVPIAAAGVNDLILIDDEIMVITAVNGKTFKVGRGVADTIPAQHYSKRPVWLFTAGRGYSPMQFGDKEKAMVIVRPDTYGTDIPLSKMYPLQLQMQYRPRRPYPPGLMMIGGGAWFTQASALGDDFDPYKNLTGKNVSVTWAHRNRITQAGTARDHFTVGIEPEPGVKYRVRIGYAYSSSAPGGSFRLIREFETEDAGFIYLKEWAESDGKQAGYAQNSQGWATINITVNAVRDGLINWQGYTMTVSCPSIPLTAGNKPGGGTGPWNPGGGGNPGGTTPPVEPPDRPDPENPGGGGGTTDPTDPDEPPPVTPPVDPEDPDTKPPKPPEPPIDPTNVPGWSLSWDHGWALRLPDQRYVPDEE